MLRVRTRLIIHTSYADQFLTRFVGTGLNISVNTSLFLRAVSFHSRSVASERGSMTSSSRSRSASSFGCGAGRMRELIMGSVGRGAGISPRCSSCDIGYNEK